ncbi:type I restriction endonuclease subunit R [Paratractidigestivibacter sp.]|uniref:type I restriction endonuclease subunit R n=1 Tax=Paratractidigestivibacter sp. TaxID=2847316 RepID=UPI002AC997C8|nr:type I restriction endonuclease subunit R [Paratractidigestivibacter sp.]
MYIEYSSKFNEAELERAIIELFRGQPAAGAVWEYTDGETLHRHFDEPLMEDRLEANLRARYADLSLTEGEVRAIVGQLKHIPSTPLYEGCRETFWLINEGITLVREDAGKPAAHIELIDFDDISRNDFLVVNQYTVEDVRTRRPDLLCFVNGIPLAILEFKTAVEEDKTIHDAWKQVCVRYARDIPSLLKYCCVTAISDGANSRLGTVFTPYSYFYAWNKANDDDRASNGIGSLYTMIEGAFAPDRFLAIVRDFVFFPDNDKHETEIVCRYPQYFAATKMLDSVCAHLRPAGDGKGGTYFGATGCGKTYTMLFLTRLMKLRRSSELGSPTVVLIVDREDLDTQASELFVTAKRFLREEDVRSIESRDDLARTLRGTASGGVYITTIQKFSEQMGLLSDRSNIVCISDEAHRTQTGVGSRLKVTEEGAFTRYGFAKYLRDGFPNATYVGFTGTPVDETIAVFGPVVDRYTMKESSDDGITVRIAYDPRLARVMLSDEQAKEIQEYYDRCAEEGSTEEAIAESQGAMSSMQVLLRHPQRIEKLAADMVAHYEALCAEKPGVVQKAMIVCSNREHAFEVLKAILRIRPEWGEAKKAEDESALTAEQLEELEALPKINIVATRGKDDAKELYEACGNKEWRKGLDRQFKNNESNFKVAVVCDMWITGFDVPSLAVMYIDKPLQRHTLVQTISRVNRVFEGKDQGLVVDYIGIRKNMLEAIKIYGGDDAGSIDDLTVSLGIFRNHLALVDELMANFDAARFRCGEPLERLACLNDAAEYVQLSRDFQTKFMGLTRILKKAYGICFPSGELTDAETSMAQFYLAVRSIVYKQTIGDAPDSEMMNEVVEEMVRRAISCTGIESVIDSDGAEDLFGEEMEAELAQVKMPITKFNALLKLVRRAISGYGRINKVKAQQFDERLRKVVEKYNSRDSLTFTSEVVDDFVDNLSEELLVILRDLRKDKDSFEEMGITFEEKAFYDILVKVRDDHGFVFEDEKCVSLAKEIAELVSDKAQYADWSTREDIKSQLRMDLVIMLYKNGYPPEWDDEVFEKVMEQAENLKMNK